MPSQHSITEPHSNTPLRCRLASRWILWAWLMVASLVGHDRTLGETQPPAEAMKAFELVSQGKYLTALSLLEQSKADPTQLVQEIATIRSFVGDTEGAEEAMASVLTEHDRPTPVFPAGVEWQDGISAVVEAARHRQIVIINEAHHVPVHRLFIMKVAEELRGLGFEYYAAETLTPDLTNVKNAGYTKRSSGFYSQEPVFGELIRRTLSLGYQPIAYESTDFSPSSSMSESIRKREEGQAKHLVERIFANKPNAKVLIHVGYHHATENFVAQPEGGELGWMAAILGRKLELDPLTIDQTTTLRDSLTSAGSEATLLQEAWLQERPIVLRQADRSYLVVGEYSGRVDMQVLHPKYSQVDGRPSWLSKIAERRPVTLPHGISPVNSRQLVQAFLEEEPEDAIPLDSMLLLPNQPPPKLMLRVGKYRVVVQDENGERLHQITLEVP